MTKTEEVECNVCGGREFVRMGNRESAKCKGCGSLERTRVVMLHLEHLGLPTDGQRVLHFAPEKGLANYLESRVGAANYFPKDLDPSRYRHCRTERFDLCREAEGLPSDYYDLIIHIHVMEHLPCNVTAVLFHLSRALRPDGVHICGIPFMRGRYDVCWDELGDEERQRRFGQFDHVRRFGADDRNATLGMIFSIPEKYDLESQFPPSLLDKYNIPKPARSGFTPHTILVLRKPDLKLRVS